MKDIKTFEDFVNESVDEGKMPDKYIGNDEIVYLKTKEDSRGAHYNLYYKGHDIDTGGRNFRNEMDLIDFADDYILSNQLYNKLKYAKSKPLPESVVNEGFHTFNGEMAMDLEDRGTKLKRGDKVTLEIQPNYYVIYGPNRKQISLDKIDFDPETLQQYVIYESVNENAKDKAKEIFDELMNINGEEIADMDKTECMHTLKMRGITGRKANEICKELLKMTSNIKESVNEAKMPVNKENIEHYIGAYRVDDDPYDVAVEIGGQYGWTQRDIEKAEKLIRKHYIR